MIKNNPLSISKDEQAHRRMLEASTDWEHGVERAWLRYRDAAYDSAAQAEQLFTTAMLGMEDALVQMTMTGEFSFERMTNAIIEDMVRMFYQQQVLAPLGDWLFGTGSGGGGGGGFFAGIGDWFAGLFGQGAAFDRGDLIAFAGGGIIDEPTLFPLAGGRVGLMGEDGPEAIMPLRRLDDGRLGIASDGARGAAVTRLSATDARATYVVNVDARGATDPEATAALVHRVVAEALTQVVPGIVEQAAGSAYGAVVDQFHRRGGQFN